ncbi:DUF362 domain-containing protein [Acidaminobacter hydrogenoformans]|uniref:4Fe-4S ferredoxin-type domain-containing protein n=1 Tax=Acidaminobacter hydrogenoformans DSM 2784 TaxID=1120920 RepID=A0A1G5S5Z7_9FIRM|nr:DUF362 domain-containing protein [Acidaminobacter hydrogenoformans]SCZ81832.1 hypothetical protein SAMN03080599_03077 [Acidaminobacter hydrogenoformans DSM 2784]
MSKVYFIENESLNEEQLGADALALLKKVVADTGHTFEKEVPLKVHFGEKGNVTFLSARCYEDTIAYLKDAGVAPSYIETNVLYRGSRTTTDKHLETARAHGFTQLPIIIADGDLGTEYDEVEIEGQYLKKCKIGKDYGKFNQFIVMSHFKGHIQAGFGGALKQLAMGFAARGGKLEQHAGIAPVVKAEKCIACGLCVEKCDFDAIALTDVALIDQDKCVGCAGCIAVCPEGAIRNSWSGSNFLEKLAEYAYGAAKGKDIIYISFISNVTEECDCTGIHMKPIAENIGVLASKDPVALDTACLDLLQQCSGKKLFDNGRVSLGHAEKIGLGSMAYELVAL